MNQASHIPSHMKAVLLTGNGGYNMLEYSEDVPVPTPEMGHVLIKVGASSVNNTDINTRTGWYAKSESDETGWSGAKPHFPRIQGADACGTIVSVGVGVDRSRIGERILVEPVFRVINRWDGIYFGSECDGGFAEYAAVPSVHAHRIESPLSDIDLASFPCAYSAAENMLNRAALAAGEHVLITGASGGVGSAAIQLAKRRNAVVTAIAKADKADSVRALGADRVIARDANLIASCGHDCFDAAIDVVGGPQFSNILQCLKRGGRYAVAGAIAGAIVNLDLRTLYLKDLRLIGCTILERDVFPNLVSYIERGEIKPLISCTYSLKDMVKAQEAFLTKQHIGKIILIP